MTPIQTETSPTNAWPMLTSVIIPFIAAIVPVIIAWIAYKKDRRKMEEAHKLQLKTIRKEHQSTFQRELDMLQIEALKKCPSILKYCSIRQHNPYALLSGDFKSQTFMNTQNAKLFLKEGESFIYGEVVLWLPRELRNNFHKLYGIIAAIIRDTEQPSDKIALKNQKIINSLKEIISGERNLHKQVRKIMGTENRQLANGH